MNRLMGVNCCCSINIALLSHDDIFNIVRKCRDYEQRKAEAAVTTFFNFSLSYLFLFTLFADLSDIIYIMGKHKKDTGHNKKVKCAEITVLHNIAIVCK